MNASHAFGSWGQRMHGNCVARVHDEDQGDGLLLTTEQGPSGPTRIGAGLPKYMRKLVEITVKH